MIAVVDYDAGNMMSVCKALDFLGAEYYVTRDITELRNADKIILPGVGAFGDAMEKLKNYGLIDEIRNLVKGGKPFLGICLGMQIMFEQSDEAPGVEGLKLLEGKIKRIPTGEYTKIPHMGWNSLHLCKDTKLFADVREGAYVYFVHSYYLDADDKNMVAAQTEYNVTIDAAVECGNIYGCQFHPEKSSDVGLGILNNFVSLA